MNADIEIINFLRDLLAYPFWILAEGEYRIVRALGMPATIAVHVAILAGLRGIAPNRSNGHGPDCDYTKKE